MILKNLDQLSILEALRDRADDSVKSWNDVPHYSTMFGIKQGIELFAYHVSKGHKILCVHDSDCDGINTYMLGYLFFKVFNYHNIELCITDRKKGYGFRPYHITDRVNDLPHLVITADNGITSHAACDVAKHYGIDVIITDHHQVDVHAGLPNANVVIDPHQEACTFKYPDINGTFVYWYFLKGLQDYCKTPIDMENEFIPELCISTISDVMPLVNINRFIVKKGIEIMPYHKRRWLKSWLSYAKKQTFTAEDLAFDLIPAINATSRLADAEESAIFYTRENEYESKEWLTYIQTLNQVRKKRQHTTQDKIETMYKQWIDSPFILIPGEDLQKGLLGPIAGRLAEKYKKPAIVLTKSSCGKYFSGSGRSIGEVDLLGLVKDSPYVDQEKTGGHNAACGVSFNVENLNNLWFELQQKTSALPRTQFIDTRFNITGYLDICKVDYTLFNEIEYFQPFGHKFEKPMFMCTGHFTELKKLGKDKNHYSMVFNTYTGCKIRAVQFFFSDELSKNKKYNIIYNIAKDDYNKEDPNAICIHIKGFLTEEEMIEKNITIEEK